MTGRQLDSAASLHRSRSVADLLDETATHAENVVRGEIRLAVVNIQDQLSARARRLLFVVLGAMLAFLASVVLLIAGIMRLSYVVEPWLATTIVGLLVAMGAMVFLLLPTGSHGAKS